MKKKLYLPPALILLISICFCGKDPARPENIGRYINGLYQGETEKDWEGYTTFCTIRVVRGLIAIVDWQIYDNYRKRIFDDTYEEVYTGNQYYIQQCRDNMIGMKAYGPKLIETQDLDQVDSITGATWCYNKFKEVVTITLEDANHRTLLN